MAALSNEELGLEETKTDPTLIATTDTPLTIDEAQTEAYKALDTFSNDYLKPIDDNVIKHKRKENCLTAISNLQTQLTTTLGEVKNEQDSKEAETKKADFIKNCKHATDMANRMIKNIAGLTSGNSITSVKSALDIIGTASAALGGPVGAVASGICAVLSTILSLFGGSGGQEDAKEVVNDIIDRAINDDIYAKYKEAMLNLGTSIANLNGYAEENQGIVENPETTLKQRDYELIGNQLITTLESQFDTYKANVSIDSDKQKYLPNYLYYYCSIFHVKRILLTLQCALLRANHDHDNGLDKGNKFIWEHFKSNLLYLNGLPTPKEDWHIFYRNIHDPKQLTADQRAIIENTLTVCNITMPGKLVKLINVAVGDTCVLEASDHNNKKVFPGSSFTNVHDHDTGCKYEDFTAACNLFRKLSPSEVFGDIDEYKGLNDSDGFFVFFSVAQGGYIFMATSEDHGHRNHKMYCYDERQSGAADDKHKHSMVFQLKGDILTGGCESGRFGELNQWKNIYCEADDQEWSSQGSIESQYHASFRGTNDFESKDAFHWIVKEFDYGTYTYDDSLGREWIRPGEDKDNIVNIYCGTQPNASLKNHH